MLGRVRSYQDKEFWGLRGNAKHRPRPARRTSTITSATTSCSTPPASAGAIGSVQTALVEIPAERLVFATDYPQEIRAREAVRDFVGDIRKLGPVGARILSGNVDVLLKGRYTRRAA